MKKKLTLVIIFLFCYYGKAQTQTSKFAKLSELTSLPKTFQEISKSPQADLYQITKLDTKNDSIDTYITKYTQGEITQFLYWVFNNSERSNLGIIQLKKNDSGNYLEIKTSFKVQEHRPSITIPITINYRGGTNDIIYNWLEENENISKQANIIKLKNVIDYGSEFPELKLKSIENENINFENFKNKIIVVNIWATSCSPCREEIPELNKLRNKYIDNKEIEFIAISSEHPKRIKKFLSNHEFNYNQTLLSSEKLNEITNSYPLHMIINKNNIIDFYFSGYSKESSSLIETQIINQLKK